jgi:hypothetical protein
MRICGILFGNREESRCRMKNLKKKPQDDQEKVVQESDPFNPSEVRERQRRAAALVLEWSKEEDDGVWPLVEEELGLRK